MTRLKIALLALLTVIAYSPAMRGPFVFDDVIIINDPGILGYQPFSVFKDSRLLQHVIIRASLKLFGQKTLPLHLIGLTLHLIAGLLVFYVFKDIFRLENNLSLFGLGLFWLHPMQTQAVIYIAQSAELLCTIGILVSFIGFVNKRHLLTVLGFIFALISKESALMIPVLWLAWIIHEGEIRKHYRKILVCLSAGIVLLQTHLFRGALSVFISNVTLTTLASGFFLLSKFILPTNLTIDHDLRWLTPYTIPALILTVLLSLTAWKYRRTVPGFSLIWVGLLMIPHALAEPLGYLAEHHFYLPSVGIFLMMAYFIGKVTHAHTPIPTATVECHR